MKTESTPQTTTAADFIKIDLLTDAAIVEDTGSMPDEGIISSVAAMINTLYEARKASGLSVSDLADKANVAPSLIKKMEAYRAVPRFDTVLKLARVLNVGITLTYSSNA